MDCGSVESSIDPYDLCSDDDTYLTNNNVAEMTPRRSDRAARLLLAAMLYLNSPPEAPKNCGQVNSKCNDYHFHPVEISSTFWLSDITNWRHQQDETHSKYTDLSNVAHNIDSIKPHGVGVEARCSLGEENI
jgi:hypothetical protein